MTFREGETDVAGTDPAVAVNKSDCCAPQAALAIMCAIPLFNWVVYGS